MVALESADAAVTLKFLQISEDKTGLTFDADSARGSDAGALRARRHDPYSRKIICR
jgi:hypothetical protein